MELIVKPKRTVTTNSVSRYETVAEEQKERQEIIEQKLRFFRAILPDILKGLSKIKDPRDSNLIKHGLLPLLFYGLLLFVLQVRSRREANQKFTRPQFVENIKLLFPNLETIPHADTLNRVLAVIDVEKIQDTMLALIKRLIRKKKFKRYLLNGTYTIAIDGTQKFTRKEPISDECLHKKTKSDKEYYYVYVVEASLVFANGLSLPLLTEILEFSKGDIENNKQDCEQRAFKRITRRIKENFPRLPICVVLDGLFANGPAIELCTDNNWDYMITLKDDSLSSVWQEFNALKELSSENQWEMEWGDRNQRFIWVNDIEYTFGPNEKSSITVHMVVCEESWQEEKDGETVTKTRRFAWLSRHRITNENVHKRCNLKARCRWSIEEDILIEKHHGYEYEHCYSTDWQAMKGFHYLMRCGHLINVLAFNTIYLAEKVNEYGVQGLIFLIKNTLSGPWLDADTINSVHEKEVFQIRFI